MVVFLPRVGGHALAPANSSGVQETFRTLRTFCVPGLAHLPARKRSSSGWEVSGSVAAEPAGPAQHLGGCRVPAHHAVDAPHDAGAEVPEASQEQIQH